MDEDIIYKVIIYNFSQSGEYTYKIVTNGNLNFADITVAATPAEGQLPFETRCWLSTGILNTLRLM